MEDSFSLHPLHLHYFVFLVLAPLSVKVISPMVVSSAYVYPKVAEVFENESVTFTLVFNASQNESIVWNNTDGWGYIMIYYLYPSGQCAATYSLLDPGRYIVDCNASSTSLKIEHVWGKETGQVWSCSRMGNVYTGTLFVIVRVSYVDIITNSSTSEITINENETSDVRCRSSYSHPNATMSLILSNGIKLPVVDQSTKFTEKERLWQTETLFKIRPNRSLNNEKLHCVATNYPDRNVTSKSVNMNILFPPSRPPDIESLQNATTYYIQENRKSNLTCWVDESNPPANLNWTCNNTNYDTIYINNTRTIVQFSVSRNLYAFCVCSCQYRESRSIVIVNFDVLYPPDQIVTALTLNGNKIYNVSDSFTLNENATVSLNCSANGNPEPSTYSWIGLFNSSGNTLNFTVSRYTHGNWTCGTANTMNTTNGRTVQAVYFKTYNINVLYPPDLAITGNYSVLEGQYFYTSCLSQSGRTTNQSVQWLSPTGDMFPFNNLTLENISRQMSGIYTCLVNYTLDPTHGERLANVFNSSFFLNVMYPPDQIVTTLNLNGNKIYNVSDSFTLNENATVSLNCSANGNPEPSTYSWIGMFNRSGNTLNFTVSRYTHGNWTCGAVNTMNTTNGRTVQAMYFKTYNINVLYPPDLAITGNYSVLEGQYFYTRCLSQSGRTTNQSVQWLSPTGDMFPFNNLTLANISRQMSGVYICLVNYTMDPTYGEKLANVIKSSSFLNVMYPPENVEVFLSLGQMRDIRAEEKFSVIENSSLTILLNCSGGGNPKPTDVSWTGVGHSDSAVLMLNISRESAGNLTCLAKNTMWLKSLSNHTVTGVVNKTYEINILYPPEMTSSENYFVLEGEHFYTTCFSKSGRTTSQSVQWLSQTGDMFPFNYLTMANISRRMSGVYTCLVNYTLVPTYGSEISDVMKRSLSLNVLYPPENIEVFLSLGQVTDIKASGKFSVIENSSLTILLNCTAGGNPKPTNVSWTGVGHNNSAVLMLNLSRESAGNLTCSAKNTMQLSYLSNRSVIGNVRKKYEIDILYPPEFEELESRAVIEGDVLSVSCSKPGRSTSVNVRWLTGSLVTLSENNTLTIQSVTREDAINFTCELYYTIVPTYGEVVQGSGKKSCKLQVLFPPENIVVKLSGLLPKEVSLPTTLVIIENLNNIFGFDCTASGNPNPSNYFWSGFKSSQSRILALQATRQYSGTYTCHAENVMQPTDGTLQTGYKNKSFVVDILYAPKVVDFTVVNVTEGSYVSKECMYDLGKTSTLKVCWQKGNKTVTCENLLSVFNVTKEDAGVYHCTVHFTAKPTFGEEVSMSIQTGLLLQVNAKGVDQAVVSNAPSIAAAVGGVLAGVVVVVLVAVVFAYFIWKRKHPHKSTEELVRYQNICSAQRTEFEAESESANIYVDLKPTSHEGIEIKTQSESANLYVDLKPIVYEGCEMACKGPADIPVYFDLKPPVSEDLAPAVSDHEYQELASLTRCKNTGQKEVYENLKLSVRDTKGQLQTEEEPDETTCDRQI